MLDVDRSFAETLLAGLRRPIWEPGLVVDRITEGLRIVTLTAGRVGPKQFGNAMPQVVHEFEDHVRSWGRRDIEAWMAEIEAAADRRFTADEMSRAEEALSWPYRFLFDDALGRDALWVRCGCIARGSDIERLLRWRRKRADRLVVERSYGAPDVITIHEDVAEDIARKVAAWANEARSAPLSDGSIHTPKGKAGRRLTTEQRKAIVAATLTARNVRIEKAARIRFAREIKAAQAIERKTVIRRQDVMPERHFNVRHLYSHLDRASSTLAGELMTADVPVRAAAEANVPRPR